MLDFMTMPAENKKPPRLGLLIGALLVAGALYFVSLPWQRSQWERTQRLREETAVQERRLKELSTQKKQGVAPPLPQGATGDIPTQLDAARALLARGDRNGAGVLLKGIEDAPSIKNDSEQSVTLSQLFQQAGWMDRALTHAQRAVSLTPDDVPALLQLAIVEALIGWSDECRQHVARAMKLAPESAEPHIALALTHDQVGALKEAEAELLIADRLRPNDLSITLLLFQNQMRQRAYDRALATAEKGLQTHPSEVSLLRAQVEATIERTLSQFTTAGQKSGNNSRDLQTALDMARRYQQLAPDDLDIHFQIGKVLRGMGDEAGAIREWEACYAANPRQAQLARTLGQALIRQGEKDRGRKLMQAGEATRAEASDFNSLLLGAGMGRRNPEKNRELARWCQTRGRWSNAILAWEQVLSVAPTDPEALREREKCLTARASNATISSRPPAP
jgi:tetratricopeptide (TPR) repeat protein